MTEYELACGRLLEDLLAAGVPPSASAATARAYRTALESGAGTDWRGFYVSAFAALAALADVAPGGSRAYARLAALADDDLGAAIIVAEEREAVRARLVEAA